jgi:hypothetical protein
MYFFVNWVSDKEGKGPDVPEGASFTLLAETYGDAEYALFRVGLPLGVDRTAGMTPVPDALWEALAAAESYAPAMALVRQDMRRCRAVSQSVFGEALLKSLQHHLGAQRDQSYFLAQSRRTELGYRTAGTFYWLVAYRPDRRGGELTWVSQDFWLYSTAADSFEVDEQDLKRLYQEPSQTTT